MVLKLCGKGPQFARAYRFPGAHRTSNALDRLMNHQDRRLYAMRSLHGTPDAARLAVRAMAWSCTCSLRLIQQPDKPGKIPSFQHVYEGVLPWSRIFSSTSSR
jgi:hypothetical protein